MENSQLSEFGIIFLFIIAGSLFVSLGLLTAYFLRPHRPNYEKLTVYECGEDTLGGAWGNFSIQYYVIALVFILFEVEIVFLFPWATIFAQESLISASEGRWAWFALIEMLVFVGILALGLAYVWVKGDLDWIRPEEKPSDYRSPIPEDLYEKLNEKYS